MVLFKIFFFVLFVFLFIWTSGYDLKLGSLIGLQLRKEPRQLLNVITIFLILLGSWLMVYSLSSTSAGITTGSAVGLVIACVACTARFEIHN